ncbi:MAG: flagellar export chaperone FliS [Deltaproteobacteria bacterium]|nr:flagellar export chaperone FliS [Deltaproteobacteria bacterium]
MQQYDAYRKATIDTSDNVRVVSLLFDGAMNFLKIARMKMEERDIPGKGIYIGKATAIVGELASSLNMEEGGEIARNLRRLYDFILDRLLQANLKNDAAALGEAINILEVLRGAWKEMERIQVAAHAPPPNRARQAGMAVQA